MNTKARGSTNELLTCFFKACENRFRFMAEKHGYSMIAGLVEYRQGRQIITPWRGQAVTEPFRAVMRLEKNEQALEILYGEKEFIIEGYAYYDRFYRLGMSEMLLAVRKGDSGTTRSWLAIHEKLVEDAVERIARTVKKHWKSFLQPAPKIIERALTIRSKRIEQGIREQYKKDIEAASREGAKAFMEKDFVTVIALLTPYEPHLNPADAKKLGLARRNLLESA